MFEGFNVYLLMAVAGFFSGLGNVFGQWVYKKFIEPRVNGIHKQIKRITKIKKYK